MSRPLLTVDLANERALVGAILGDPRRLVEVAPLVKPSDLSNAALGMIFAAALALDAQGSKIDTLTLAEELQRQGVLTEAGGLAGLAELDTAAPTSANAAEYAGIVADAARRRRLDKLGQMLVTRARATEGETEDIVLDANKALAEIGVAAGGTNPEQIRTVLIASLDVLDAARNHSDGVTGTASGLPVLDKMLTGFHEGELIILAARPGVGKTSLAVQMALHVAHKSKRTAAVFSLEMPAMQLGFRLLANAAKVSLKRLRQGGLSDFDLGKINDTAAGLADAPLYIDDSGSLTVLDLRAKGRRLKQKHPDLALIVIDYLQLMSGDTRSGREQEVGQISRGLKQLAKELGVPVLALAQMSRKVEERKGGKPQLSDLRESGSIEQDADVVMFIHPEPEEDVKKRGGVAPGTLPVELIVAKQRNGPTGIVSLLLHQEYTRFEMAHREEE